jgi:hypothetical protein
MKLREDRPYGTVYGHSKIAYEQDGRQFGPDKMEIEGPVLDPPVLDPTPTPDPERSRKMKEAWERRKAAQSQVNS